MNDETIERLEYIRSLLKEYLEDNWFEAIKTFISSYLDIHMNGNYISVDWDNGYFIGTTDECHWIVRHEGKTFQLYSEDVLSLHVVYDKPGDYKTIVDKPLTMGFPMIFELADIMNLTFKKELESLKDKNHMKKITGSRMFNVLNAYEQYKWLELRITALKNLQGI